MKKVTTINLNGNAYQLEESGYEILKEYLDASERHLAGNPDREEIITDIEQAIADRCRSRLSSRRTVVSSADMAAIIAEMGPVQDASTGGPAPRSRSDDEVPKAQPAPKRLYRLPEGAYVSGVCNGLAAYFGLDVTLVRVLFAVTAIASAGGAMIAYLAMRLLIPEARTTAQTAVAHGDPSTAEEIVRRARRGYYESVGRFRENRPRPAVIVLSVLIIVLLALIFVQFVVPLFNVMFRTGFAGVPNAYFVIVYVALVSFLAVLLLKKTRP